MELNGCNQILEGYLDKLLEIKIFSLKPFPRIWTDENYIRYSNDAGTEISIIHKKVFSYGTIHIIF